MQPTSKDSQKNLPLKDCLECRGKQSNGNQYTRGKRTWIYLQISSNISKYQRKHLSLMRKLIHEKDRNVYAEQCVFHGYFCFSLIIMQMKISKKYFVNSSVRKIVLKTHSTFSQTIANWVYFSPTKNKSEYGSGVAIVTGVKYVSTLHNSFSKHSSYGI